jgi:hypothetical protein
MRSVHCCSFHFYICNNLHDNESYAYDALHMRILHRRATGSRWRKSIIMQLLISIEGVGCGYFRYFRCLDFRLIDSKRFFLPIRIRCLRMNDARKAVRIIDPMGISRFQGDNPLSMFI